MVDRKKLITTLRRCETCQLLFRIPTVTEAENSLLYNEGGDFDFASRTPTEGELETLLDSEFAGSEGSFSSYLPVLEALGSKKGGRLLDFGCAWGYRSWQLARAGYSVQAFEINQQTCDFARTKLGVDAHSSWDGLTPPFDVFFSNHVLEHLPRVREVIDRAWDMLSPGGLFIAFTPNGSEAARANDPAVWHNSWGSGHPNFLDDCFYEKAFFGIPKVIASTTRSPYAKDMQDLRRWAESGQISLTLDLSGEELLIAVRKPG